MSLQTRLGALITAIGADIKALSTGKAATVHGHALTDANISGVLPIAQTPLTAILQAVYPVGALYISYVSTSPATVFGFGTWVAIQDRMLIGVGSNARWDAAGDTGGVESVTLTAAQSGVPAHPHPISDPGHAHLTSAAVGSSFAAPQGSYYGLTVPNNQFSGTSTTGITVSNNTAANASQSHENMPPFLAVYMWRRTA